MARWILRAPHYLTVPGTEWEYEERSLADSRMPGSNRNRVQRKRFQVPLFLNPEDPADWNYVAEQKVIVAWADGALPNDIVFEGEPTPDMEPVDDEAIEISDSLKAKWTHPVESLPGNFSQSLLSDLEQQLAKVMKEGIPVRTTSVGGATPDAMAEIQAKLLELAEQNAAMKAQLEALTPEPEEAA